MRLIFHLDHFVKLASNKEDVVERSVTDLENHGAMLDAMELPRTPYNAINIHIGAHYGDKEATGERFCEHFERLSPAVQDRLTVENDDTESLWSVPESVDAVYDRIGIPVTYDDLHHQFTSRGLTRREALLRAATTWETTPIVHYSEPRQLHQADPSIRAQNHSDEPLDYGLDQGESDGIWLANGLDAPLFITDEFNSTNYLFVSLALDDRNTLFTTPHVLCKLASQAILSLEYVDAAFSYYADSKQWDEQYLNQLRHKYLRD